MWDVQCPERSLYECKYGLRIDRQLNASINLYLKMEGLSPSPRLLKELRRAWRGFTPAGGEAGEELDEPMRAPRPVNPKSYVYL